MNVLLIAAMSADGKIAESEDQNSLDWTSKEDLRFFVEKTKEAGVLIMGRKTFDTIGKPLKDRKILVMTRNTDNCPQIDGVDFTSESPEEIIRKLEESGQKQVVIAGGASVYGTYLAKGLVSDVYLTVEPYLFGKGVSVASGFNRIKMKLVETKLLGEQSVLLHYQI